MKKKIIWLITIPLFALVALSVGSHYLYFYKNQRISNSQALGEKEFSDFLIQKKKLPQAKEEVFLIAVGDISYSQGMEKIIKKQNDINYPLLKIKDPLKSAGLFFEHYCYAVQAMEKYKGKFILHSLSNFVFDQPQSEKTKEGLIIKAYSNNNRINKISLLPIVAENLAQPRIANKDEANKILQRLNYSLANQDIYSWNNNNFEKEIRRAIYRDVLESGKIISKQKRADLNNNLVFETYILENGKLTITENKKTIWQSPNDWWIDDFVLADSNNDGIININLSLWKSGSFGTSKPFWIKEDDMSVKNHFFILDFSSGSIKQVWGSSNLAKPNCEFKIADIDNDGKNDLVVIEGDYLPEPKCTGNYVAIWKWNDWGFSNEWRSEEGGFTNLEVEKIDGKNYIIVDNP